MKIFWRIVYILAHFMSLFTFLGAIILSIFWWIFTGKGLVEKIIDWNDKQLEKIKRKLGIPLSFWETW